MPDDGPTLERVAALRRGSIDSQRDRQPARSRGPPPSRPRGRHTMEGPRSTSARSLDGGAARGEAPNRNPEAIARWQDRGAEPAASSPPRARPSKTKVRPSPVVCSYACAMRHVGFCLRSRGAGSAWICSPLPSPRGEPPHPPRRPPPSPPSQAAAEEHPRAPRSSSFEPFGRPSSLRATGSGAGGSPPRRPSPVDTEQLLKYRQQLHAQTHRQSLRDSETYDNLCVPHLYHAAPPPPRTPRCITLA